MADMTPESVQKLLDSIIGLSEAANSSEGAWQTDRQSQLQETLDAIDKTKKRLVVDPNSGKLVWYVLMPISGAALAPMVYLLLRVGVLSSGTDSMNVFGLYAFAALTGLFAEQAIEMLDGNHCLRSNRRMSSGRRPMFQVL
jgi:hypothetical protein